MSASAMSDGVDGVDVELLGGVSGRWYVYPYVGPEDAGDARSCVSEGEWGLCA